MTLADPLAAKGKIIFEGQSCNACHGDGGAGKAAAPALVGIGTKLSPDQLAELFKHRENERRRHAANRSSAG
jgi:mono/diheme cytochrome c family protein